MDEFDDEPDYDPAYVEKRMREIYLETFTMDRHNPFDFIADTTIKELIESIKNDREQEVLTEAKLKELKEQRNVPEDDIQNLELDLMQIQTGFHYRFMELTALQEMKILYAVKHFEINLKDLIQTCFPDVKPKELYKWDYTDKFLREKGIHLPALEGYAVFIQLRDTSNCLKHSSNIRDRKVQAIPEFKNKTGFDYKNLRHFYNKVQPAPLQLLQNIANAIHATESKN